MKLNFFNTLGRVIFRNKKFAQNLKNTNLFMA